MINLGNAGVSAVKWSAFTTVARFALQFVAQIVLARLLGPESYGIFGIALVVYTFSTFLVGFGFGWSLLQRANVTQDDIRFAFTWQVIVGFIAMLAVYFSAPLVADYFRDTRLQAVVEWMALACLLSAAASPASNLLQRDLNFKAVGLVQVVSYACGYVLVGIPLALVGFGVNALVAAWLVQAAISLLANYAATRHSLRPLLWYASARSVFGTGGMVFITNIGNWLLNNLDRICVGRLLNVPAVGLYSAGFNIATMPNSLLLATLQPAFMAAATKLQTDPRRLGRIYLQMLAATWVLILPFFVFMSMLSVDLVQLIYGPKWSETAGVASVLFLAMPAYVMFGLSTPVLWNSGRQHFEFLLQVPALLLGAIGFLRFAHDGIHAVAIVTSLIIVCRATVIGIVAFRAVSLRLEDLLPYVMRGGILSLLAALGALVGRYVAVPIGIPFVSLLSSSLITLCLFSLVIWMCPRVLGSATVEILIRFCPRIRSVVVAGNGVCAEMLPRFQKE